MCAGCVCVCVCGGFLRMDGWVREGDRIGFVAGIHGEDNRERWEVGEVSHASALWLGQQACATGVVSPPLACCPTPGMDQKP